MIDAMQRIASLLNNKGLQKQFPDLKKLHHVLRNKAIDIFMLSNQLPLLQLGRSMPEVANEHEKYCSQNGARYADRFANQTHIIAFSDPNDLLSYTIPSGFKDKYLDSRLCANVSNISINVAYTMDLFGMSELANPIEAHLGYDHDERVIALLANGLSHENADPLVKDRCKWVELTQ